VKPAPFLYFAPSSSGEAIDLLARHGAEARPLAGGQSLIPLLNFRRIRPAAIVDLAGIAELGGIHSSDGGLRIGAMTRQRAVERDPSIATLAPLLALAMPWIAHAEIRNRGTIGGSLSHADPCAELPAVMLALGATMHARSVRGDRMVAADDFITGPFTTALQPDELLVAIEIPVLEPGTTHAFEEVARRHGDSSLFGVAASVTTDSDGRCTTIRIAAMSTATGARRLTSAERVMAGAIPDARCIVDAADAAANEVEVIGDVHASPAFRRHLARVLTRRVLARACSISPDSPAR
jgi:carbon-monoxide dehydrogenase medium subunit